MSIASEITRINTEVSTQTDLMSQIQTALEGKSITSNVETCTVRFLDPDMNWVSCEWFAVYTAYENGEIVTKYAFDFMQYQDGDTFGATFENVIKGTRLIWHPGDMLIFTSSENIVSEAGDMNAANLGYYIYPITINGDGYIEKIDIWEGS